MSLTEEQQAEFFRKNRAARDYFNGVILAAQLDLEMIGQIEKLPDVLRGIGRSPNLSIPGLLRTRVELVELPKFEVKLALPVVLESNGLKCLPVSWRNGMHNAFRWLDLEPNDIKSFFIKFINNGFDDIIGEWTGYWRSHLLALSEMCFEDIFNEFLSVSHQPSLLTEDKARAVLAILKDIFEELPPEPI